MWLVVGVVLVAGALMALARRSADPTDLVAVSSVSDDGLLAGARLVPWASVHRVELITRRSFGGTWFGFEIRSEEVAGLSIDGSGSLGQQFLAHTHHLRGFDHAAVTVALTVPSPRTVCYDR